MSKTETASSKAPTKRLRTHPCVHILKGGGVIVFPTETLYGLGADALDEAAVEKVFQLKGRDPRNPIPCSWPTRKCFIPWSRRYRRQLRSRSILALDR